MKFMRVWLSMLGFAIAFIICIQPVQAFCGFYVAKADTDLYNQASQVVIARDGQRTVLTMANDYQGEVKDFAMVVPVPVILKEEQVNVGKPEIIKRLDDFSAPRLVEYFDPDPCNPQVFFQSENRLESSAAQKKPQSIAEDSLGVTIEEQFTVGEYEIVILSAKESDGLETWLIQNGYNIPQGASSLLQPYINQDLKFFVAKVNLEEFDNSGFQKLRPLSMAFESPKFMLPIRLGMLNAQGDQDLIVYLLSPKGQIELTNYRTVKIPSDVEIPEFVQQEFPDFFTSMLQKSYEKENKQVAFLEYAWDMASCDPCSAQPLNQEELKQAGVFWLNAGSRGNVFITRLHVRYSRDKFPEDLIFQETSNRQLFQGRYVVRHPFRGQISCDAGQDYRRSVQNRQETEAQTLASLTGWDLNEIRNKIEFISVEAENSEQPWWRNLWN
ncbi:hypothetical protein Xen7305DRAFT_00029180 [Xenococcus sp. PCC 7305]|uniref:DUF2330 domain-containing protein n=1 Tax=Xenococcus sp. PCC 7305 TaxID=102125 RepID=UPI0002ACE168|nr:DUF2330 domain-containing protein [Xenococcus sp. PCC 7305]ELS03198.1 hypothetical protein Xen7305DRAFT_00029180 [Xenococcus sp. PCC 7305]